MFDHTFSELANHQIKHQATHKVGYQPGDCIWSLQSSSGVCVSTYGYSLYHPGGVPAEGSGLGGWRVHSNQSAMSTTILYTILVIKL